ncbi:MAG: hypothetical protein AAGF33_05340, partial [Pseudomonadota bacterium]
MKLLALFAWLIVPLGLYGIYAAYGTPYAIWSYTFHDKRDPSNSFAERYYTTCTYVGWGWHSLQRTAQGGKCP